MTSKLPAVAPAKRVIEGDLFKKEKKRKIMYTSFKKEKRDVLTTMPSKLEQNYWMGGGKEQGRGNEELQEYEWSPITAADSRKDEDSLGAQRWPSSSLPHLIPSLSSFVRIITYTVRR